MKSAGLMALVLILSAVCCWGYPLDAAQETGIERLEGHRLIQQGRVVGEKLPSGALLTSEQIRLRLKDRRELKIPPMDTALTEKIVALLAEQQSRYSIALLDLSDPDRPRYVGHRDQGMFNPGSLGKILIAVSIFQALAERYPDDIEARRELLRTRELVADEFIRTDERKVAFWDAAASRIKYRQIAEGDRGNLWSWLDQMLSPSSNAAASMVLREYLLMVRFAQNYPVDAESAEDFFSRSSKKHLMDLLIRSLHEPMRKNGLDPERLRQGGFFTWRGKELVPGGSSRADARILLELLLKMEQGRLVDEFSSLELKKLLYMTEKRIRYASAPALKDAAIYYKSGSLYSCQPEEGFVCGKYQGNRTNLLNSMAIIEEQGELPLHYLVVVNSNVLRVNSAVAHQTLAMRIHRLLQALARDRIRKGDSSE